MGRGEYHAVHLEGLMYTVHSEELSVSRFYELRDSALWPKRLRHKDVLNDGIVLSWRREVDPLFIIAIMVPTGSRAVEFVL